MIGCEGDFRVRIMAQGAQLVPFPQPWIPSSMGVEGYVATLRLEPRAPTDGDRTFAEWSAEFECDPAREAELVEASGHESPRHPG